MAWLRTGTLEFTAMSDLPSELREELSRRAVVLTSRVVGESADSGAIKLKLRLPDGHHVESVLMRSHSGRNTLCLSTQVGCAMGCEFCRTARMGLRRNLGAGEIVEQVLLARSRGPVDNIVLMGMGEPLANWDAVRRALEILTAKEGHGYSPRRITASTVGLVSGIRRMMRDDIDIRLAVSLVSARTEVRDRLMPTSRANPLSSLHQILAEYQEARGKRITLEVVMLGGITDSPEDVRAIVGFSRGLSVLVNLIPWNNVPGMRFRSSAEVDIQRFRQGLRAAGIPAAVRRSMGRGVFAACGQLSAE